jgi:hypothetical protein
MMRLGIVAIGVAPAAMLLSGCERTAPVPASQPAGTTSAPSSQPCADEMANVRELMQNLGQRGSEGLPPGHPPIGDMAERPTMPEMPPSSRSAVNLEYTAPDTWQKEAPHGMFRREQYRLPRAAGDSEDGELAVFGGGIGGGVEANVQMWRSQFTLPDGQPIPDEGVVRQTLDVNGLDVTVVDIAGRYRGRAMMLGTSAPAAKDSYRMLGAIVETPGRPWYFKAVGPAETIAQHREEFMDFLHTLKVKED